MQGKQTGSSDTDKFVLPHSSCCIRIICTNCANSWPNVHTVHSLGAVMLLQSSRKVAHCTSLGPIIMFIVMYMLLELITINHHFQYNYSTKQHYFPLKTVLINFPVPLSNRTLHWVRSYHWGWVLCPQLPAGRGSAWVCPDERAEPVMPLKYTASAAGTAANGCPPGQLETQ